MMRAIFGYYDGSRVITNGSNWGQIVSPNSRSWKTAEALVEHGLAFIYKRDNGFYYVQAATKWRAGDYNKFELVSAIWKSVDNETK